MSTYRISNDFTMAVRCKKPSATKSCLVVIGISFIISIYNYISTQCPSIQMNMYLPKIHEISFLISHETWHKTWPLQISMSLF